MVRASNRVGIAVETESPMMVTEVDGDSHGASSAGAVAVTSDAETLEQRRLQMQKELLRKKKAERRAHAKQRKQPPPQPQHSSEDADSTSPTIGTHGTESREVVGGDSPVADRHDDVQDKNAMRASDVTEQSSYTDMNEKASAVQSKIPIDTASEVSHVSMRSVDSPEAPLPAGDVAAEFDPDGPRTIGKKKKKKKKRQADAEDEEDFVDVPVHTSAENSDLPGRKMPEDFELAPTQDKSRLGPVGADDAEDQQEAMETFAPNTSMGPRMSSAEGETESRIPSAEHVASVAVEEDGSRELDTASGQHMLMSKEPRLEERENATSMTCTDVTVPSFNHADPPHISSDQFPPRSVSPTEQRHEDSRSTPKLRALSPQASSTFVPSSNDPGSNEVDLTKADSRPKKVKNRRASNDAVEADVAAATIQKAMKKRLVKKTKSKLKKARSFIRSSSKVLAEESLSVEPTTMAMPVQQRPAFVPPLRLLPQTPAHSVPSKSSNSEESDGGGSEAESGHSSRPSSRMSSSATSSDSSGSQSSSQGRTLSARSSDSSRSSLSPPSSPSSTSSSISNRNKKPVRPRRRKQPSSGSEEEPTNSKQQPRRRLKPPAGDTTLDGPPSMLLPPTSIAAFAAQSRSQALQDTPAEREPAYSHKPARRLRQYGDVHHFMATRIQARQRGIRGRSHALERKLEFEREIRAEALFEVQEEASVRIQAHVKGFLLRKRLSIDGPEIAQRLRVAKKGRHQRSHHKKHSIHPHHGHADIAGNAGEAGGNAVSPASARKGDKADEVAQWPEEFNLEPLDRWDELNAVANANGDLVTHAHFLSKGKLRVFCGTWNLHAKKPRDDLRLWVALNRYHVVAVGTEECVHSIAKSVVFTSKKQWEDQLRDTLGQEYVLVASHALTAIHNVVFVHESVLPLLHNIQSDAVATGLGNQLGNKGGIGIAFSIGRTSFAFVNCHFDAHQHNVAKRNANFHRINQELKLTPHTATAAAVALGGITGISGGGNATTPVGLGKTTTSRFSASSSTASTGVASSGATSGAPTTVAGTGAAAVATIHHMTSSVGRKRAISESFDRVFWYGDLNYRINGTRRMIDLLLLHNQHAVLRFNDQLRIEMAKGAVFAHFQEGPLHFRPTYKFDKHSNVYDSGGKQRIPSWTDRILHLANDKPSDIELLSYRAQMSFQTSDHRPVGAVYQVAFALPAGSAQAALPLAGAHEFSRVLARGYRGNQTRSEVCALM